MVFEFDFCGIIIFLITIILAVFVICMSNYYHGINRKNNANYVSLKKDFDYEKNKSKSIQQKIILSNNFNQLFFERLFKINKELLLIQNLFLKGF